MSLDWQQFGLKRNPFDTVPLVEGGDLPIEKAFVGRENERKILENLFEQDERLCLIVSGNVGVGKTSLINFEKFIWKYRQQKLLFSSRREIEASRYLLDKKNFLLEIIGSVLREIELIDQGLLKDPLLRKVKLVVDVSQSFALSGGFSVAGYGVNASRSKDLTVPVELTISSLEGYLRDIIDFIKSKQIGDFTYSGLIVHVNNFDIVLEDNEEAVKTFFNEIRDLLQIPNIYFVFIGPTDFYEKIIVPMQRVRSIFHDMPLTIKPLSKTEINKALQERMELLKSDGVRGFIKPFDEKLVSELYDLFEGDVRSIMRSLITILREYQDRLAKTLTVEEGLLLLCRELWRMIEHNVALTDEQRNILKFIINHGNHVSNKELAETSGKQESNVSSYYIKPLRDAGILEMKKQVGKKKYWGLSKRYLVLSRYEELQRNVESKSSKKFEQLKLL